MMPDVQLSEHQQHVIFASQMHCRVRKATTSPQQKPDESMGAGKRPMMR
jgi:hypothetical protein